MRASDFVASYIEAWNHRDAQCIADHLTKDGIYYDVPSELHHPKPELVKYLSDFFSHDQHHYSLAGEVVSGENTIAFQYRVDAEADELGEPCWFGAEFVTLEGDQAVQIADYYKQPVELKNRSEADKYAKSGLNEEQLESYKMELTGLMENEQAYLNPSLTLPKLSSMVRCPINHLSQVINAGFGMSFFDYLNSYRIDEAKRLLTDNTDPQPAILTVAFEVGFNSNSAFYSAFKRSCGQTPAYFRQENKKAESN